jgi:uncharacterized membrane protein YbhN (UPF0104 family)
MAETRSARPRGRPYLPAALRVGASALLLAAVAWAVDLGAALDRLTSADPWAVAGLLALVQAQVWLSALRWRLIARRLGVGLAWPRAAGEYYAGTLINQVLPGGVAGDAARAWRHTHSHAAAAIHGSAGRRSAGGPILRAVVLERLAGQAAFLLLAATGIAAWPVLRPDAPGSAAAAVVAAAAGVLGALALGLLVLTRLGPAGWRRGVAALGPDAGRALLARGAWRVQAPLNLLIAASYVGALALAAAAVGPALPWPAAVTVLPLVLLAMLVPVSVGGWGLREGAAAALWPSVGLSAELGVAAALLYGLAVLVGTLPGLVVLVRPVHGPRVCVGGGYPPSAGTRSARKA